MWGDGIDTYIYTIERVSDGMDRKPKIGEE